MYATFASDTGATATTKNSTAHSGPRPSRRRNAHRPPSVNTTDAGYSHVHHPQLTGSQRGYTNESPHGNASLPA